MNEIVGEDTSLDKDSNALVKNFKPSPIIGQRALAIRVKRIFFVVLNNMVDTIKQGNKMLVSSIDKIHTTNLEIEEQRTQIQEEFQEKHINYFKSRDIKQIDYSSPKMLKSTTSKKVCSKPYLD
jgi:hypothetical protein